MSENNGLTEEQKNFLYHNRGDGTFDSVGPEPPWVQNLRTLRLWRTIFHYNDDEAVEIERALLRDTARAVRARGALPLFLVTNFQAPCLPVDGQPPWLFRTLFEDDALPHVDVALDPTWTLADDPHPDARAHGALADAVEKALRAAHLPAR